MKNEEHWDLKIRPHSKWHDLRLGDVFRYRDLLFLFVRRDFVAFYKQTIFGPVWFFVQPIITAITFTIVFGNLAAIGTNGIPKFLFYLSGITLWNFFAETLTKTSDTFTTNAGIFGKVYFPRLIVPLSVVASNLTKLGVQLLLFLGVWAYYLFTTNLIFPNAYIALLPFLILLMGFMGLSMGILISSMTTKYRDLKFLVTFGVQLMMYASPIVYPLSSLEGKPGWIRLLILSNPVTSIIELFKHAFLGQNGGQVNLSNLLYSLCFTCVLFFISLVIFNKVEKSFTDTI